MGSIKVILICLCIPMFMVAQDDTTSSYHMVELSYMNSKVGMETAFEKAVEKHNSMFHAEGSDTEADLFMIQTGDRAGWYVWITSTTFSEMDSRSLGEDHAKDWNNNVAPKIDRYGAVEYWRLNDKLSNVDEEESPLISVWTLDIESGEYYRMKSFMEKVNEIHKKMDEEIAVYNNQFGDGSKDVTIVFSMDGWSDFDKDDWKMKVEYDKVYGEGSWENALEEWEDFVKDGNREVWKRID